MSTTTHQPALLVTQAEAAELLGVSRNTVVRLVGRGVLKTVRLAPGMKPRVRRSDVLALAERPQASP